jgi:putative nucleotidyltransferase with HDIG domain
MEKQRAVYKIVITRGPVQGQSFILSRETYVVGRGEDSSPCILDKAVSKRHCLLELEGEELFVTDLGSTNGTFLDGKKILPQGKYRIEPGSVMFAAPYEEEDGAADDDLDAQTERLLSPVPSRPERTTERVDTKEMAKKTRRQKEPTLSFKAKSSRTLSAIYDLLNAVGTEQDRRRLLDETLALAMQSSGADRGFIFLLDEKGAVGPEPAAEKPEGSREGVSGTIMKSVVKEGSAVYVEDMHAHPELAPPPEGGGGAGVSTVTVAPIKSGDRLLGLVYLDSSAPGKRFMEEDAEILAAVGIQLGTMLENIRLSGHGREFFIGVIRTLVNMIEAKDKYTHGHSERVTRLSLAVGKELALDEKAAETLRVAGLLHDIGKVGVPEAILNKPGSLTDEEFALIKKHPEAGADFIKHLEGFEEIIAGIRHHHERYDGRGYPDGLAGEKIPLLARIIAVADSFDAMTSDRAYRKALSVEAALGEVVKNKGSQFDPAAADAFGRAYEKGKIR